MKIRKFPFHKVFYLYLFLFFSSIQFIKGQEEKFHRFHADVRIDTSGIISVKETISIYAAGNVFKRGIVRGLPTSRPDSLGKSKAVKYNIIDVQRDGKPENYSSERSGGEQRLYIGNEDVFLDPGNYTYNIQYESKDHIRFYDEFDELYWNVNGRNTNIKIDTISATIYLPEGVQPVDFSCYTGAVNSTSQNCTKTIEGNVTTIEYIPTYTDEGLTFAIAFPKGVVAPPPPPNYFQKKGALLLSAAISMLLFSYYLFTWRNFGIDPPKPTPYPQFTPPDNLSPASIGMLKRGIYWNDLITASIINLAVKGFVKIEEKETSSLFGLMKDKTFTLHKIQSASAELPQEEALILEKLFRNKVAVTFDGEYDSTIEKAVNQFRSNLGKQWNKILWKGMHVQFWILPILTLLLYFVLYIALSQNYFVAQNVIPLFFGFLALNLVMLFLYIWLIQKPAKEKLRLKSLIKGFEMYLSAAEEKQIQQFNPPAITPEQFEQLLPFAIALDAEKVWGKQFQSYLNESSQDKNYEPSWHNGSFTNIGNFSHSLNSSLSNSLQHSSTKPSSSSGSGGGGFSGGGGGGGSVGGW